MSFSKQSVYFHPLFSDYVFSSNAAKSHQANDAKKAISIDEKSRFRGMGTRFSHHFRSLLHFLSLQLALHCTEQTPLYWTASTLLDNLRGTADITWADKASTSTNDKTGEDKDMITWKQINKRAYLLQFW